MHAWYQREVKYFLFSIYNLIYNYTKLSVDINFRQEATRHHNSVLCYNKISNMQKKRKGKRRTRQLVVFIFYLSNSDMAFSTSSVEGTEEKTSVSFSSIEPIFWVKRKKDCEIT